MSHVGNVHLTLPGKMGHLGWVTWDGSHGMGHMGWFTSPFQEAQVADLGHLGVINVLTGPVLGQDNLSVWKGHNVAHHG